MRQKIYDFSELNGYEIRKFMSAIACSVKIFKSNNMTYVGIPILIVDENARFDSENCRFGAYNPNEMIIKLERRALSLPERKICQILVHEHLHTIFPEKLEPEITEMTERLANR